MRAAAASHLIQPAPGCIAIEWLTSPAALERLAVPWTGLEAAARERTALATFDFLGPWYRHYAGEYGGMPLVGTVWHDGRLVAVAPLTLRRGRLGRVPVTRVDFAPNDSIAGEFLVHDAHADAIEALIESLVAHFRFDVVCLNGFIAGSAQQAAVLEAAARCGLGVEVEDHAFAQVDLQDGYAAYRAALSGHFRRNMSNKARKIEAAGAAIDGVFLEEGADRVEPAVERMIAINEASYKLRGQRLAEHHRAFLFDLCARLGARGRLALPILRIGGVDAAYMLGVVERGCFYDITLAYAESFERVSPGTYLTQKTLERLAAIGVHTMVSHGAHEYKKHWASRFVPQQRVYLFPRVARAAVARFVRFGLLSRWRRIESPDRE